MTEGTESAARVELGDRLKEAREYLGFSQEEVANHLGVPRSAISLIETGARKVDALELTKLAKLYQRRVAELTGEESPRAESDSVQMVARAAAELSPEDQSEVLRFAQFLRSRKTEKQE
jgi:transcriptional regulator with XRE-family HTH domain